MALGRRLDEGLAEALGDAVSAPAGELARVPAMGVTATVRPTGRAAKLRGLLARLRTGGGQLYVARRDRDGQYRVCAGPLSYIDTEAGRLIAVEHTAGDGITWRSLIPADAATLRKRLSELMAAVTGEGR